MSDVASVEGEFEAAANGVGPHPASIVRGTTAPLSVLAVSPFSPFPQDAGQRKRVHQTLQLLKDLGLSVTFLLYPFEGSWAWRYQNDIAEQLRSEYDDVLILPAARFVGAPPRHGSRHALYEWWDDLLGDYLIRLSKTRHFDVLLVNNVWLSKALTLVPPCVVKVIDMHDLFHRRERAYATGDVVPEFFRIIEEDELFGLNRADICVSISLPEARYLAEVIQNPKVVYLPHASRADEEPAVHRHDRNYLHPDKVVFGFLGTSHGFNVAGVSALLEELCRTISQNFAPIELVFGGTVCESLDSFAGRIRITRLGWVENEDDFYDRVDFFLVPIFYGSGFKIKVADILERGKPALFSEHAVEGLSVDEALVSADVSSMVRAMSDIALSRPPLARYGKLIEQNWRTLTSSVNFGVKSFISAVTQCIVECIVDLRNQPGPRQPIVLLSVVAMARELKDFVRVRIIVDQMEPWIESAARYLSPAISIESSWQSSEVLGSTPNRVWWHFGTALENPAGCGKTITDLRFSDQFDAVEISGELVLSPGQCEAVVDAGLSNWSFLPYLTESTRWDPVARIALGAASGTETDSDARADAGSEGSDETIIIVDGTHDLGSLPNLLGRLGVGVRIVDVSSEVETGRLLAALHRMADRTGNRSKILDGCTGVSPLRYLVLEMALLCGIPISTNAFGHYQELWGAALERWRTNKTREDQSAFRTLVRRFDSMRGGLRRL